MIQPVHVLDGTAQRIPQGAESRRWYVLAWLLVLAGLWPQVAAAQDTIRDSVVKIHSTQRLPDFVRPWTKGTAQENYRVGRHH